MRHIDRNSALMIYIDYGSHNISFTTLDISIIDDYTCVLVIGKIERLHL